MLQLKDREWNEFLLRDIFLKMKRGKRLKKADQVPGNKPYVSSSAVDNGVDAFIGNNYNVGTFADCLSLANSGSVGKTFFHPYEFVASDHVTSLQKDGLSKYCYLFIAVIVSRLSEKYNFNREISDERLNKEKIILPINVNGTPDYDFMEQYIKERENLIIQKYIAYISKNILMLGSVTPLDQKEWKAFRLLNYFEFIKGNQNNMAGLRAGTIPLVSARNSNNGYKCFSAPSDKGTYSGKCLTINNDGDGGAGISYYQPFDMLLDTHVTALVPKITMTENVMLFISSCITIQRSKFGHGYSLTNARLSVFQIMLPVDHNGAPDYVYMGHYAKDMIARLKLQYLKEKAIVSA